MGFPAYILETLNKYGKVNLGPLGSFNLDYTPAKWHVSKQYFEPPQSFLSWSPSVSHAAPSDSSLGALTSVISGLHDIPYDQASIYCHQQIDFLNQTLREKELELIPFGVLTRKSENDPITFVKNPAFESTLKFDPLRLVKLNIIPQKDTPFQWWLVLASALSLATLFFLINKLFGSNGDLAMYYIEAKEITYPMNTSLKDANIAPIDSYTVFHQKVNTDSIIAVATIITGTFCQKENSARMKKLIEDNGFQLYEEKLQNDCVRLGILLDVNESFDKSLLTIRNNIEPSAWVLDH
ncbi:MAG: hypothetical protein ABIR66_02535 [Saprospiraceae bacterium]